MLTHFVSMPSLSVPFAHFCSQFPSTRNPVSQVIVMADPSTTSFGNANPFETSFELQTSEGIFKTYDIRYQINWN